ncbi:MAG: CoA transferase, partial [Chromatiales bacterium]
DRQFEKCASTVGKPELSDDPRYADNASRIENRTSLVECLQAQLQEKTTGEWLAAFAERGVPAGPINDIGEVLSNAHARERALVRRIENAAGESVPMVSNPVDFGATPVSYRQAPPLLGEHTDEVLREWLGYSADTIAVLRNEDAI